MSRRSGKQNKRSAADIFNLVCRGGSVAVSVIAAVLASVLILYSGSTLYETLSIRANAANTSADFKKYKPINDDGTIVPRSEIEDLELINEDYRAWLTVFDTNIDYPVMQGEDDLYYASHDAYGQPSLTGAIYLSAENSPDFSDTYNLIFGHHMDSSIMFGALDLFLDEGYFESHRTGLIVADSGIYDLYNFAVIRTDAYESNVYSVGNRMEEVVDFLRTTYEVPDGRTTVHIFDEAAVTGAERIVALSTCADAVTNGRLVVFAVMTRRSVLTLEAKGYEGVYDAQYHDPEYVRTNYDGCTFSYSIARDGEWIPGLPDIKDVGEYTATIRAYHEDYGTAYADVIMKVTPRPITIQVADASKICGDPDPEFRTYPIEGIIDGFEPVFTIRRTNTAEQPGTYRGVLVAEGETVQGNYIFTYLPGNFTILPKGSLLIIADGYDGIYDAEYHGPAFVEVNITEGTSIWYSIDGGATWSAEQPTIIDVGLIEVFVRATNPQYSPAQTVIHLRVSPRPVTVTAQTAFKRLGEEDPEFSAIVEGLLGDDTIEYTISRPRAGIDEAEGVYPNAIVPAGEIDQGNYIVTYIPADFTIIAPEVVPTDAPVPTEKPSDRFTPGPRNGNDAWALINLIALIITVYYFIPIFRLRAKFGRIGRMKKFNEQKEALFEAEELDEQQVRDRELIMAEARELLEKKGEEAGEIDKELFSEAVESLYYKRHKFQKRFRVGLILELVISVAAIIAFILTEDMRLPMVLVDEWTILMLALLALCWIADVRLARYRDGLKADEQEDEDKDDNEENKDAEEKQEEPDKEENKDGSAE